MQPKNPPWCAAAVAYYSEPAPLHRLISVCNYGCVFPAIAPFQEGLSQGGSKFASHS